MSKIDLDAIRVDILKKREKIERLQKRIEYLSKKLYYTIECEACGQHWDAVILAAEYDRIYFWKNDHGKPFTVMSEKFWALQCPGCGHEHALRKGFNCRYETEVEPDTDRANEKKFPPNKLVSIKKIYNNTGKFFGYGEPKNLFK